jgi:hypothetical protein
VEDLLLQLLLLLGSMLKARGKRYGVRSPTQKTYPPLAILIAETQTVIPLPRCSRALGTLILTLLDNELACRI